MRKTAFLLLTAFMLVPAAMFGDSYSKLWKQVDEAAEDTDTTAADHCRQG